MLSVVATEWRKGMMWLKGVFEPGESILFRRGAFVSMIGLAGVVVIFAAGFAARTDGMQWPVTEMVVMGMALAGLGVAFFAAGVRIRLEPGETRPIRPGRNADYWVARLFGLLAIPFVSLAIGFVMWRTLLRASVGFDDYAVESHGFLTPAGWLFVVGAGLGIFLSFQFLWEKVLGGLGHFFLTNRRVLRFIPGFWSGRIEVLDLADVAEIRGSPLGITLAAASREAMRRLRRDGSTEPAGIDRLDLPLSRFRFPGAAGSQYDRAVRLLGREPLNWHAPALPRDLERLFSLAVKYSDIAPVLAAIPMAALAIAVILLFGAQGSSGDAMMLAMLASILVSLGLAMAGWYLFLWRAARKLTPENTALLMRAALHPDWAPGRWPRAPYIAARRAALKRRERIASWLTGRPVPFEDAPGPEAYGGGWRE